jgi:hypothetical protein
LVLGSFFGVPSGNKIAGALMRPWRNRCPLRAIGATAQTALRTLPFFLAPGTSAG